MKFPIVSFLRNMVSNILEHSKVDEVGLTLEQGRYLRRRIRDTYFETEGETFQNFSTGI